MRTISYAAFPDFEGDDTISVSIDGNRVAIYRGRQQNRTEQPEHDFLASLQALGA